ncbi:MAG TPA: hypothetical protein VFP89_14125 [Propionibacteriaceae bacterium]|nr:hypothetical protein [Propionibacteriaceae bacterium]
MNAAELAGARAYWVTRNLLAVPPSIAPAGAEPSADSRWRLHFSADAGITVAADRIDSTHALDLRYQPGGLPASVVGRYPHLTGYLALSLRRRHARQAETLLKGQLVSCAGISLDKS